jgi:hypothetical protein
MRGTGRRADNHRMSADECGARTQALAINDYPKGFGEFSETWTGSRWTVQTVPDGQTADDLEGVKCRSAHWCMAVGTTASGDGYVLVADCWNGSAWKIQPVPAQARGLLLAVSCPAAEACRAVGSDRKGLFSEVLNGKSWAIRPVPVPRSQLWRSGTARRGRYRRRRCPLGTSRRASESRARRARSARRSGTTGWRPTATTC